MSSESESNKRQSLSDFSYDQLAPGPVRLLRILPLLDETKIECTLQHVELGPSARYYALSYVWGRSVADQTILLNGKPFQIRPNLLYALKQIKRLQDDSRLENEVWLWIDAVSINQNDLHEKALQIPLMSEIYSQATAVLICFGRIPDTLQVVVKIFVWLQAYYKVSQESRDNPEESEPSLAGSSSWRDRLGETSVSLYKTHGIEAQKVMKFNLAISYLLERTKQMRNMLLGEKRALMKEEAPAYKAFPPEDEFWLVLMIFMDNEWFYRVWTFQELVLAKHAIVLCNDAVIEWKFVRSTRQILFDLSMRGTVWAEKHVLEFSKQGRDFNRFEMSCAYGNMSSKREMTRTLGLLMFSAGSRLATNPKDFIYGIYALIEDDAIRQKLSIDYNLPDASVFTSAMKLAISEGSGHLTDIPLFWRIWEGVSKAIPGLPSWCPVLSNLVNDTHAGTFCRGDSISKSVRDKYKSFGWMEVADDNNVLHFRAIPLEKVAETTEEALHHDTRILLPAESPFDVYQELFMTTYRSMLIKWLEDIPQDFTPDLDKLVKQTTDHRSSFESFQSLSLRLQRHCAQLQSNSIWTTAEATQILNLNRDDIASLVNDVSKLVHDHNGRYFFKTTSGKIGFSPLLVQPRSYIVFLPNSGQLHVLSPNSEQYVTTCYVDGYMRDELLHILESYQGRWKDFFVH